MRHKLLLIVYAAVCFWFISCASWKPIVKTIDDVARLLCAKHYSQLQGVNLERAWDAYCGAREDWAPWIDPLIEAQEAGNQAAPQPAEEKQTE